MNNEEISKKEEIESALAAMIDDDFLETSKDLLEALGYRSDRTANFPEQRRTLSGGFQPGTKTPIQSRNSSTTWNQ